MEKKISCNVATHPIFLALVMLLMVGVRGFAPTPAPAPIEPDDPDSEFYICMANCTHIYQNYELCLTKCATFDPPALSPEPSFGLAPVPSSFLEPSPWPAPVPSSSGPAPVPSCSVPVPEPSLGPAPVPSSSGPAPVPSPAGSCPGVIEGVDRCIHGCYENSFKGKKFVDVCLKACRNEGFKECDVRCKEGCGRFNIKCKIGCLPKCGYCMSHL